MNKNLTMFRGDLTLVTQGKKTINEYDFDIIDEERAYVHKATIIFEDGKFHHCTFPFHAHYTRQQWAILAQLEQEISKIEAIYAATEK
jgi:hypothetical protein